MKMGNYSPTWMQERLSSRIYTRLIKLGQLGEKIGSQVFTVGGFVRDLLLGVENQDIDITVEGKGIDFAKAYSRIEKGKLICHPKFGTAVVTLRGERVDIATARREFYPYPAALPQVEFSHLQDDLFRRDFTINSLAICLNPSRFGQLVDLYGGQKDLKEGIIRVLHPLSFRDDPTRIFRAIRLATRYSFHFEEKTLGWLQEARREKMINRLSGTRLRNEIVLILSEDYVSPPLRMMANMEILSFLHPNLRISPEMEKIFKELPEIFCWYYLMWEEERIEKWLVSFIVLTQDLKEEELKNIMPKLRFTRRQTGGVLSARKAIPLREKLSSPEISASNIYFLLHPYPLEVLFYLPTQTRDFFARRHILQFLTQLRRVKTQITGRDLQAFNYPPGPHYRELLKELLTARLDGKIKNKKEERQFLLKNFPPGKFTPSS
jgi:tRNA nucleotidyltransferase (CCA-adding enzyme)